MPYRAILRLIHYDGTSSTHSTLVGAKDPLAKRKPQFRLFHPSTWRRNRTPRRNSFDIAVIKKEAMTKDSLEMNSPVDWSDMMEWPLEKLHTVTMRDGTRHIVCSYDDPQSRERIKEIVKGTPFDELLNGGYDPIPGSSRCQTIHLTLTPECLKVPLSP